MLDFSLVWFGKRCQTYAVEQRFQPMKKILLFLVIASVSSGLNHPTVAGARDLIHKGDVVVVPLPGEVSPSLLMFLRRAEKAAENNGAAAIIFEMNTYGGRLDPAEEVTSGVNHHPNPPHT